MKSFHSIKWLPKGKFLARVIYPLPTGLRNEIRWTLVIQHEHAPNHETLPLREQSPWQKLVLSDVMNWVCDHRSESQFKQLRKSPKKRISGLNGIRTRGLCVSAAVLYQPELWRSICWGPANLLSSSTRERNETKNEMMWTAGIQMNWVCDHRSESQSKQLRKSPKKRISGLNGIRTRGLCVSAAVLYQPELWRSICWGPANLLSSSTRERNETKNELMWTAGIQMNWVCDHRSESQSKELRKSPKKRISGLQRDSNPWPLS